MSQSSQHMALGNPDWRPVSPSLVSGVETVVKGVESNWLDVVRGETLETVRQLKQISRESCEFNLVREVQFQAPGAIMILQSFARSGSIWR